MKVENLFGVVAVFFGLAVLSSCNEKEAKEKTAEAVETIKEAVKPEPVLVGNVTGPGRSPNFDAVLAQVDLGGDLFAFIDVQKDIDEFGKSMNEVVKGMTNMPDVGQTVPTEIMEGLDLEAIIDELGIGHINAAGISSYRKEAGAVGAAIHHNKFYMHLPDGRVGLFKVFGGEAGEFDAVTLAPESADLVYELDFNVKAIHELVVSMMNRFEATEMIEMMNESLSEPAGGVLGETTPLQIIDRLDTQLLVIADIDPTQKIDLSQMTGDPTAPTVPKIELLIAIDEMDWMFELMKKQVEDANGSLPFAYSNEAGVQKIAAVQSLIPAEQLAYIKPVMQMGAENHRLYISTSTEFLEKCLAANGAIRSNADFTKAMEGLPETGNSMSFVSSEMLSEIKTIYEAAMASSATSDEERESMESFMSFAFENLDQAQGSAFTNLPNGMLWSSNTSESNKSAALMSGIAIPGVIAAMAMPAYVSTQQKAKQSKNINTARQLILGCRTWAADYDGAFPPTLDALYPDYIDNADVFLFESSDGEMKKWKYEPGYFDTSYSRSPLIISPEAGPDGDFVVGFVGGHVLAIPFTEYSELQEAAKKKRDP